MPNPESESRFILVMMSQIPNPRELARAIWIDQFGDRDVNRIFPPAPEDQDISQDEETLLMAKGVNVDVRKYHNHAEHLRRIALYIMSPEFVSLTDKAQTYLLAHAQNHQLWMKRMQETLSMPPAQTQAMQPAMPGMMPGQAPAAALPPGSEGGAAGTAAALQEQARAGIQGN